MKSLILVCLAATILGHALVSPPPSLANVEDYRGSGR